MQIILHRDWTKVQVPSGAIVGDLCYSRGLEKIKTDLALGTARLHPIMNASERLTKHQVKDRRRVLLAAVSCHFVPLRKCFSYIPVIQSQTKKWWGPIWHNNDGINNNPICGSIGADGKVDARSAKVFNTAKVFGAHKYPPTRFQNAVPADEPEGGVEGVLLKSTPRARHVRQQSEAVKSIPDPILPPPRIVTRKPITPKSRAGVTSPVPSPPPRELLSSARQTREREGLSPKVKQILDSQQARADELDGAKKEIASLTRILSLQKDNIASLESQVGYHLKRCNQSEGERRKAQESVSAKEEELRAMVTKHADEVSNKNEELRAMVTKHSDELTAQRQEVIVKYKGVLHEKDQEIQSWLGQFNELSKRFNSISGDHRMKDQEIGHLQIQNQQSQRFIDILTNMQSSK